jgi:hypothetical protein
VSKVRIEQYIESRLSSASVVDYFSVPRNLAGEFNGTLKLSTGFVTEDGIKIYYSADGTAINGANRGVQIDREDYDVDLERGMVYFNVVLAAGFRNLAVSYEAGFEVDSAKVYKDLPDGLAQAALLHAAKLLTTQPGLISKEKANIMPSAVRSYGMDAINLMNRFLRPRALCLEPFNSVVEYSE